MGVYKRGKHIEATMCKQSKMIVAHYFNKGNRFPYVTVRSENSFTISRGENMTLNKARRDMAKQNASGVAVRNYKHLACGRGTNHVGKVTADHHKLYCDYCQDWFEKGVAGEFVWADDGTKVGT